MRAFLFLTLTLLSLSGLGKADPEARRRPSSRKQPFAAANKVQTGHYEMPEEDEAVEKAEDAGDKRKGKCM